MENRYIVAINFVKDSARVDDHLTVIKLFKLGWHSARFRELFQPLGFFE
jgi:hypothetical protein